MALLRFREITSKNPLLSFGKKSGFSENGTFCQKRQKRQNRQKREKRHFSSFLKRQKRHFFDDFVTFSDPWKRPDP